MPPEEAEPGERGPEEAPFEESREPSATDLAGTFGAAAGPQSAAPYMIGDFFGGSASQVTIVRSFAFGNLVGEYSQDGTFYTVVPGEISSPRVAVHDLLPNQGGPPYEITGVNDAPVLSAIGNQTVDEETQLSFAVAAAAMVPDEPAAIAAQLTAWSDTGGLDLILTTGGTGLSPRDTTPEATLSVAQRLVPGIPEAMRAASLAVTPHAMLSRGVAVIRGRTLIINLPGSPKGARENLAAVAAALPHALEKLRGSPAECGAE